VNAFTPPTEKEKERQRERKKRAGSEKKTIF
jgi:hypothetical protein